MAFPTEYSRQDGNHRSSGVSKQLSDERRLDERGFIMKHVRMWMLLFLLCLLASFAGAQQPTWPPALPGAVHGTVTFSSELFLKVPDTVTKQLADPAAVPFVMAKTAPTVDLAFHGDLPDPAINGTGWSAWGDIALASDGRVYSGIGDHGDDAGGNGHAYLYQWDPKTKVLKQVADLNAIVPRAKGEPTWTKLHARIEEGVDGNIYFVGTLNDGNTADKPQYKWSEAIPGAQLFQYNPVTGKAALYANLPAGHCTATALMDRQRNIWWCNLETGPNGLWALDMATKQPLYQAPAGSVGLNRNFAMDKKGLVYFNGPDGAIWKCDAKAKTITRTKSTFGPASPGMRSSTDETKNGWIYGHTMNTNQLFRYQPSKDKLELLGSNFLAKGDYITVCVLSPDQKYLYYLPGAHGQAFAYGTPVVQYNIAKKEMKVLAFLRDAFEQQGNYVPGGTYGVKISADGSTLYVNLNGHAADATRLKGMTASGFGLTAFMALHIPASERK